MGFCQENVHFYAYFLGQLYQKSLWVLHFLYGQLYLKFLQGLPPNYPNFGSHSASPAEISDVAGRI
jgi:hypothetical protein